MNHLYVKWCQSVHQKASLHGKGGKQNHESAREPEDREIVLFEEIDLDSDEPISVQMASLVSEGADEELTELKPLYDEVDTEALDVLLDANELLRMSFYYENFLIDIHGDSTGEISLLC